MMMEVLRYFPGHRPAHNPDEHDQPGHQLYQRGQQVGHDLHHQVSKITSCTTPIPPPFVN